MKLTGLKEKQQGIYENTKIAYLNFSKHWWSITGFFTLLNVFLSEEYAFFPSLKDWLVFEIIL